MTTPTFKLSPAGNGRYQMLAYDAGADPRYAIEMYVPARTDAAAIAECKFEASYAIRDSVMIRDVAGRVIYNGPVRPVAMQVAA